MGGRPTKQGISYFSLDTDFDDDLQLLITEIGAEGLGILITIWQAIYKSNGYYIEYDEKLPLKVKQKCFSPVETIISVIKKAVTYNVFNNKLFKKHQILTSRGIQKRYFVAARKKKQIEINPNFLLIDISDIENGINVAGNSINSGKKDTKEKEKEKEKEAKTRFLDHVDLLPKEFETLTRKYGKTRADRMVEVLNNYFMANTKRLKKYTSHYGAINSWVVGDVLEKMPTEKGEDGWQTN